MDVLDAARRLGINSDAVRKRLKRGHLQGELVDGRWYVLVPPVVQPRPASPPPGLDAEQTGYVNRLDTLAQENAALVAHAGTLARQVEDLERERTDLARGLDEITTDRDYLRHALAAALTIKALLPEHPESSQPRPWWQVWRR